MRSSGSRRCGCSIGARLISVSASESAPSDAAIVGEEGAMSALKYEGAGDPGGVKNLLSCTIISSLLKEGEGDVRWGGISRGNDDNKEVGDSVVVCGTGRNMLRWIGSSLLITAGGRGPFSRIA